MTVPMRNKVLKTRTRRVTRAAGTAASQNASPTVDNALVTGLVCLSISPLRNDSKSRLAIPLASRGRWAIRRSLPRLHPDIRASDADPGTRLCDVARHRNHPEPQFGLCLMPWSCSAERRAHDHGVARTPPLVG